MNRAYLWLADFVLLVHFAFVAFVVLGLCVIWLGYFRRWEWVRNFWFRAVHLLAIAAVAAEALLGIVCPLTVWEDRLRLLAGGGDRYADSFIQHWLHRLMFFQASPWVFTVAYVAFFLAVAASFWIVKPKRPVRGGAAE